jgi:hypothetical protein
MILQTFQSKASVRRTENPREVKECEDIQISSNLLPKKENIRRGVNKRLKKNRFVKTLFSQQPNRAQKTQIMLKLAEHWRNRK